MHDDGSMLKCRKTSNKEWEEVKKFLNPKHPQLETIIEDSVSMVMTIVCC